MCRALQTDTRSRQRAITTRQSESQPAVSGSKQRGSQRKCWKGEGAAGSRQHHTKASGRGMGERTTDEAEAGAASGAGGGRGTRTAPHEVAVVLVAGIARHLAHDRLHGRGGIFDLQRHSTTSAAREGSRKWGDRNREFRCWLVRCTQRMTTTHSGHRMPRRTDTDPAQGTQRAGLSGKDPTHAPAARRRA
jgi:hypothetical protein